MSAINFKLVTVYCVNQSSYDVKNFAMKVKMKDISSSYVIGHNHVGTSGLCNPNAMKKRYKKTDGSVSVLDSASRNETILLSLSSMYIGAKEVFLTSSTTFIAF